MKIATRILLPTLLLGASVALAQPSPVPAPAPDAAAPSVKKIDVGFRGTLRDALKRIAEDGGINVVATGELDTSVEVHLKGVTAQQALRTIARTYSLRLDEDGSIFTLRPMTAAEKESAEKGATASAAPSVPAPAAVPAAPPVPPMAAMPPMPPMPPTPPQITADDLDPSDIKERVRQEVRKAQRRSKGARDVSVRGQSLEVKEGDTVDNAVVFGGNMVVKGRVEDDAVVFGGNLDIHGTVEGDATAFGGNVILHEGAAVEGSVASMGGTVIRNEGSRVEGSTESFGGGNLGALVAGEVKNSLKKEIRREEARARDDDERDSEGGLAGFILKFAALFGLGFLGQLFFPSRMKDVSAEIKARPFKSALTGLLGGLALFVSSVVLSITLIGIPVAAVLVLAAMLVTALGLTAVASELGMRVPVLRGRKTQAVVLALGSLILLGLGSIPGLGVLVMLLACLMGFGAAIRTRFGNRPARGIPEPLNMSSTIGV